jgi:selenium-binding protein 1
MLSSDDKRLVVVDYFLNAGLIGYEGDHKVRVLKVGRNTLSEDTRFKLDFNTAFPTGPARPHGIAIK